MLLRMTAVLSDAGRLPGHRIFEIHSTSAHALLDTVIRLSNIMLMLWLVISYRFQKSCCINDVWYGGMLEKFPAASASEKRGDQIVLWQVPLYNCTRQTLHCMFSEELWLDRLQMAGADYNSWLKTAGAHWQCWEALGTTLLESGHSHPPTGRVDSMPCCHEQLPSLCDHLEYVGAC